MRGKFLAEVLAASLVLTMAPVVPNVDADAAQKLSVGSQQGGGISNLPGLRTTDAATGDSVTDPGTGSGTKFDDDLVCGGFWTAHTKGIEVTTEGVTLTFHNVSTGDGNYHSPIYVAYTGDEAVVNGAGYVEYGVVRSDLYGWNTYVDLEGESYAGGVYAIANAPLAEGSAFATWGDWQAANKAGADYTVSAVLNGSVLVLYINANGLEACTAFRVDADKPVYLSLTGELCTLSDINKADTYYDFTNKIPEEINAFVENVNNPPVEDETVEHLYSGTAWWFGSETTGNQILSGDGSIEWYVGYYENVKDVAGAFCVELLATDDVNYYITTGSDVNAWYAEGAAGDAITGVALNSKYLDLGHIYKITVTRSGQDFKITYYDVTAGSTYAEFEAKNTNFPNDVGVHVMAEVGKYRIETESFATMPEVVDNNTPLASYPLYTPTPTEAPTLPSTSDDDDSTPGLELECGAWWTAHTAGVEVNSEGIAIKFRNVTSGSDNWDTPVVVGYSANEPVVNGDGYKEYVVIRSDAYAWSPSTNSADVAAWESSGYKMTAVTPDDWGTWLAANKSGVDCLVQAIKVDGTVYIQVENNGVKTVTSFAVPDGEKFYISLTGELCKLTNIKNTSYTGIDGVNASPSETPEPTESPEPDATTAPDDTTDSDGNDTTGGDTTGGDTTGGTTGVDTPQTPTETETPSDESTTTKKTMKISSVTATKNTKKVKGTISVKNATVKVKVGSKAYKKATVSGKKFTFKASAKLKKGTTIKIKATKSGYKAVTKSVKVK